MPQMSCGFSWYLPLFWGLPNVSVSLHWDSSVLSTMWIEGAPVPSEASRHFCTCRSKPTLATFSRQVPRSPTPWHVFSSPVAEECKGTEMGHRVIPRRGQQGKTPSLV